MSTERQTAPAAERATSVPTWLAALGLTIGILLPVGGSVGAYAVMGWRVQALESRVTTDELDIKAVTAATHGQDVASASIRVEVNGLTKAVDENNRLLREVLKHLPAQATH